MSKCTFNYVIKIRPKFLFTRPYQPGGDPLGLDPGFLKLVAEKYNFKVSFNLYVEKFTFSITEEPVVGSDPHLVN